MINVDVEPGTREDAQWYAYSANKAHGLRRSNDDKARAIKLALVHPKGAELGDSKVAEHVGVSVPTVSKYRGELESALKILKVDERVGRDGKTYTTTNIGKGRQALLTPSYLSNLER